MRIIFNQRGGIIAQEAIITSVNAFFSFYYKRGSANAESNADLVEEFMLLELFYRYLLLIKMVF